MLTEARIFEWLSEHISAVFLGVLVFYGNFPLGDLFEDLEVASVNVSRACQALAPLGALYSTHVVDPQHRGFAHVETHLSK